MGAEFRVVGEQEPHHPTGKERPRTLRHDVRGNVADGKPARDGEPDRDCGVQVRARHVTHRVHHRQHNEAERECHPDVGHLPVADRVHNDGAGAREHKREGAKQFRNQTPPHFVTVP